MRCDPSAQQCSASQLAMRSLAMSNPQFQYHAGDNGFPSAFSSVENAIAMSVFPRLGKSGQEPMQLWSLLKTSAKWRKLPMLETCGSCLVCAYMEAMDPTKSATLQKRLPNRPATESRNSSGARQNALRCAWSHVSNEPPTPNLWLSFDSFRCTTHHGLRIAWG